MSYEKVVNKLNDMLMKQFFLKLCKAVLSMLGVAAFSSCDILGAVEYGVPNMDYTVMGKVVNARNEALKGIKVKTMNRNGLSGQRDSTYTDASGNFTVSQEHVFPYEKVPIIFEDESGIYKTDTVDVMLTKVKEGKGWYNGEFAAENMEITMKEN